MATEWPGFVAAGWLDEVASISVSYHSGPPSDPQAAQADDFISRPIYHGGRSWGRSTHFALPYPTAPVEGDWEPDPYALRPDPTPGGKGDPLAEVYGAFDRTMAAINAVLDQPE